VRRYADRAVCLHTPTLFWAIGQFYERFEQVVDREVVGLLRAFGTPEDRRVAPGGSRPAAHTR
jgi:predicted phosphoribosyltransferase